MSQTLPLSAIRRDGGTQPREALNPDVVADYAEALREGARFPRVTVFHDGTAYWLADGFHRAAAHEAAGRDAIEVDLKQGSRRDAVLHSVGANAMHGLRRTNSDKRRAVQVLLSDPEWSGWSNREIARQCAVSYEFVRLQRVELEEGGDVTTVVTRTDSLGRQQPASKPGPAPQIQSENRPTPSGSASSIEVEKQEAPPEHEEYGAPPEVDVHAELAHALEENQRLHAALEATDHGAELRAWIDKYGRLEGRVQQLQTTAYEYQKQAGRQTRLLEQIRDALGVKKDREIMPAIQARRAA